MAIEVVQMVEIDLARPWRSLPHAIQVEHTDSETAAKKQ